MKKVIPGKAIFLLLLTALLSMSSLSAPKAMAYYVSNGEDPERGLIIDKKVKTTVVSDWQDNLSASRVVLKNGDVVEFKITVKNTKDEKLSNIDVVDYLPSYLEFIFGPGALKGKEINWKIDELESDEEESFVIRTQIEGLEGVVNEGNFCLINKARAEAESGESDEDTASFCLVSTQKLPKAGAENIVIGTIITAIIGTVGILLRKIGRGEILG